MKQLTIRKADNHAEMINEIQEKLGVRSASGALIKAGYEYLSVCQREEKLKEQIIRLESELNNVVKELSEAKRSASNILNGIYGFQNLLEK